MHLRRVGWEVRQQREAAERSETLRREELELRRQELEARTADRDLVRAQVQALTQRTQMQARHIELLEARLFGSNGHEDADAEPPTPSLKRGQGAKRT
jgi:hypothetical protein